VPSYARWFAAASRSGAGGARPGPSRCGGRGRDPDLASEQSLLLDAIAGLVYAVAAYGPRGECQYRSVGGDPQDHEHAGLPQAMQALAESAVSPDGEAVATASLKLGRIRAVATDISTAAGRYHLRAIRLRPGLFGSEGSVLVIADRFADDAVDRARIREEFGLTDREAEVAVLLADRRRNAEIARALGISVHTARHHVERVLLKLGGCKRRDVPRVLRARLDATEGHH
jgi:DNA-binding CsgD family transcriptional regulator